MIKLTFAIAGSLIALAVLLFLRKRRKACDGKWYRNPDKFFAEGNQWEADRNVEVPADPTRDQIQEQVSGLLDRKAARRARFWLCRIGAPAVPSLCAALREERFLSTQRRSIQISQGPFETLVDILGEIGDPTAVGFLLPLVDSAQEETRKSVAMALGWIGDMAGLDGLERLLADDDQYVRSYALMGIERGLKAHRVPVARYCQILWTVLRQAASILSPLTN